MSENIFPGQPDNSGKTPAAAPADTGTRQSMPMIKLLFFVVDWNSIRVVSSVFEEEKVRFHFISKGRGTASSEILDLLGIGASDKAVILCLEQDVMVPVLFREVRKKLGFHSPGAGIAFTVPLSGINNPILQVFKESIHKNDKLSSEREGGTAVSGEIKHDLIVSIINQGYSDEFMTAAREAGATGGTVISARGLAHQGPVKFFGVSVQDEREIVIILTSREKKAPIMQAVSQACGISTKAGGIVFSLPVDNVQGLNLDLN
jgi:nitrogen regulatory protein PII